MKIFLFGYMASGKTSYGKRLAEELQYEFIDLDSYIEEREQRTIKQIFNSDGEDNFRILEHNALHAVLMQDDIVVATGGGTPCFFDNLKQMKRNGITVYLNMDVDTLTQRLTNSDDSRPLIWGKSEQELSQFIRDSLHQREPYYRSADIIVNETNPDVQKLIKRIK